MYIVCCNNIIMANALLPGEVTELRLKARPLFSDVDRFAFLLHLSAKQSVTHFI